MTSTNTILITGASRGIGLELVKQYAAEGPKNLIIAAVRDLAKARELQDLAKTHAHVKTVQLDADSDQSIAASVEAVKALGVDHINLLVNNAGVLSAGKDTIAEVKRSDIAQVFSTNVTGALLVVQAYLALIKASKITPVVANISSIVGSNVHGPQTFGPTMISYGMSKAALNYFNSVAPHVYNDIVFLAIHPGWVQTDMGKKGGSPPTTVPESATNVRKIIAARCTLANSGKFINEDNTELPF